MPCRHKGNKQALLSVASSIPHQRLCTTTIPQLPHWKKKKRKIKCFSKAAVWKSCEFPLVLQAQAFLFFPFAVTYCSAKNSSLYFKVLHKWCFITLDHLSCRHWIAENKWLSGAPALCEKQHPSQSVLSDKYATVGPVNKGSTPLLLGL